MQCAYKQDQDAKIDYGVIVEVLCLPPNINVLPHISYEYGKNGAFFAA